MPIVTQAPGPSPARRLLALGIVGGLLTLGLVVLKPFLVPLLWAAILVYLTWPLHQRLLALSGRRASAAALASTLLLSAALALPFLWFAATLQQELGLALPLVLERLQRGGLAVPAFVNAIPLVGPVWDQSLRHALAHPEALKAALGARLGSGMQLAGSVIGGIGRNAAKLGMTLFAAFFLYRDGEALAAQLRGVLLGILGPRTEDYLSAAGATTRAVVYGITLTAVAQGALAGLGYWAAGLQGPLFLALLTTFVALIPFGTPLVWGSLSLWLFLNGQNAAGLGLFLWGALVISWVDNLIRPWIISGSTRIPFLLVFFGVLGGLAAFGLIGLFLGPVVLSACLAVWREWLGRQEAGALPSG